MRSSDQRRLELEHEQPHLPRERGVGALDPRAAGGGDDRAVDAVVRLDHRAPGRVGLRADRGHQPDGVVDRLREPPAVALEREPGGLQLERGAQLEQRARCRPARAGDARAAVRLDRDQPLAGQLAQRGAERVAGDAVGLGELDLAEPLARLQLAVEDPRAQRGGERVDGRDALRARAARSCRRQLAGAGARRAGSASASSPARTSAAPTAATAPGRSPSASDAEAGRGQRLGERERRRLAGRELAQAAGEQHVGERGRDRAEEQRHRQPVRRSRSTPCRRARAPAAAGRRRARTRPPSRARARGRGAASAWPGSCRSRSRSRRPRRA